MPIHMPRLIRDSKSGVYFFRVVLPRSVSGSQPRSVYLSLKTRENKLARAKAAVLNLRVEMTKPDLDFDGLRKLINIDLKNGVFQADTAAEQELGLRILEAMGKAQTTQSTIPQALLSASTLPVSAQKVSTYDEVVKDFLAEVTPTLKATTVYKYKKTFEFFKNYFSNVDINSYTKEDIKTFKNKMLAEGKAPHTINGFLGCLRAMFEYAIKNGLRTEQVNPVDGMYIKNSKKQLKSRDQFYEDDLSEIFDWKNYKAYATKPDYFWGPLICLYTGMRPEEITTLEVKNIRQDDGIHFFQVKDAKTPAGVRSIPIHSALIKLGLFDYIDKIKDKEKLFWYLKNGHNGTKKNLSRRFSEYLTTVGVKQDDNCFYSLRHTVITRLVARNVNNSTIYVLSGHVSDKSAHYNYLHEVPMKVLKEAIETLDWHERIDFSSFNHSLSFTVFD